MTEKIDPFGDVRAEHDHAMLDRAFFEWRDYKTIISESDRYIIVGRRGTGKSALVYHLDSYWKSERRFTINILPNEEELIGFRAIASLFGSTVTSIRAGVKQLWKYALCMELAEALGKYYKTREAIQKLFTLRTHVQTWSKSGTTTFSKLFRSTYDWVKAIESPELRILQISQKLQTPEIINELKKVLAEAEKRTVIHIDRLDEGWHHDNIGIGMIDGVAYGTGEFRESLTGHANALIFLRDNIFRAIQEADNDFSRNIEPRALRLHWDPQELLYMTTARMRAAFNLTSESEVKVWNQITANELHGIAGFKSILRNTLYRPRDVISLLNGAYYQARRQERTTLTTEDISVSSKLISKSRLDDLEKEYSSVFPGLNYILQKFNAKNLKNTASVVQSYLKNTLSHDSLSPPERQHLTILASELNGVSALYSIGFLGLRDTMSKTLLFCHDGRQPSKRIDDSTELIVHPCYWPALGATDSTTEDIDSEEIFDEYEVTIYSADQDQRSTIIGRTISAVSSIPVGTDGAKAFEDWCKDAITYCFSTHLTNIALHPNQSAPQRRDIVATNKGDSSVWQRIIQDYRSRQIIFEVKNFEKLGIDEFRQAHSYLGREYGNICFIICRAKDANLNQAEGAAFREFYRSQSNRMIIKLTANWLINSLSKLRSPQKHDFADKALDKLIDEYIRVYANEHLAQKSRSHGKRKK